MADAHVLMPLTQMVDLVTQSPEEGVINFNMLHTVLHVLVQQLNAGELSVELHGPTATKLQNMMQTDKLKKASVHITQIIGGEKKDKTDAATETVIVVKPEEYGEHRGVTITKQQLDKMSGEIEQMKKKMEELTDLPSNAGLIEALRSEIQPSPVIDMFQILSLTKRIDAAEIGMNKLAGLVEDVIKSPPSVSTICYDKPDGNADKSDFPNNKVQKIKTEPQEYERTQSFDAMTQDDRDVRLNALIEEVASIKKTLDNLVFPNAHSDEDEDDTDTSIEKSKSSTPLAQLYKDVQEIKDRIFSKKPKDKTRSDSDIELPPDLKLQLLEEKFKDYSEQMESIDQNFNDEIAKLHNQFTEIEKDFNGILLKITDGMPAGDKSLDEPRECCSAVYQKLVKLQADFDELAKSSYRIIEDKDNSKNQMDALLEEIELLKTIKADKDYIEEALADKADACTVQRKVSHDQFDNACDNLSKGIEEALEKLTQQELIWQQTLDDIQGEIGTKLDKIDLGPLREFINNKLKMLQDKMKSLAAFKKEQEAAGSKNKLLRDVNCISCDKDVVMRKEMDISMRPPPHALPPTRSMGPYLAYELDVLRKQQKGIPGSRNLNYIERAIQMGKAKKKLNEDHICNRYCGGSHTITTPQQRVTRLGHFLNQWGPEASPQIESLGQEIAPRTSESQVLPGSPKETKEEQISNVDKVDTATQRKSYDEGRVSSKQRTSKSGSISGKRVSKGKADHPSSADIKRTSQTTPRISGSNLQTPKAIKSTEGKLTEDEPKAQGSQEIHHAQEQAPHESKEALTKSKESLRKSGEIAGRKSEELTGRKSEEVAGGKIEEITSRKSEEITEAPKKSRSNTPIAEEEVVTEKTHLEDIMETEDGEEGE